MTRWLRRPSPALVIAFVALLVALGGTAYAASTIVNIADPTTPSRIAKVDAAGKLTVGDGSGGLTVDGTVTANAQAAPPSTFIHRATVGVWAGDCHTLVTPPAGKALIVRQVRLDTWGIPSSEGNHEVVIYTGPDCTGPAVGLVTPSSIGQTIVPFDPGLGIPANSALSAEAFDGVKAVAFVDGFTVAPGVVPSSGVS
jgi:hypothetical protein